jgi:hypothetical protein
VTSVSIRTLRAGDLVIEGARFPVIWAPLMAGADGILGVAGFKNECIFVDFRHNRVVISRSREANAPMTADRVPARLLDGGLMSVEARLRGLRVQAIIDTGSERTIGNPALRDALYARRLANPKVKATDVYGATAAVKPGEMEIVPTINLGSVKISGVTVVFGDFHIFEVWGLQTRPAIIIGMDVLGTVNSLGIDFRRSELYLESAQRDDPGWLATRLPRSGD